jgi:uncharacterized protein
MTTPDFQVLTAHERHAAPWKNGGGVTHEVAVSPTGASLDDFDWRVSLAEVAADGPFSNFAGVDRGMLVLRGCLALQIGREAPRVLRAGMPPVYFDGAEPVQVAVLEGPAIDLNVMTRRGSWTARLVAATEAGQGDDPGRRAPECSLLMLDAPFASVALGTVRRTLRQDDAIVVSGAARSAALAGLHASFEFHRVDLWRCVAGSAARQPLRGDSWPC